MTNLISLIFAFPLTGKNEYLYKTSLNEKAARNALIINDLRLSFQKFNFWLAKVELLGCES